MDEQCTRVDPEAAEKHHEATDWATYMEEKARTETDRAERELTLEATEGRREVAGRYQKDADAARREVKRLEKASAQAVTRLEHVEQRMQMA